MDSSEHLVIRFFKKYFLGGMQTDPEQEDRILNCFRRDEFGRKEQIFLPGDTQTRHYLVEEGLVRLFLTSEEGREFNILFAREGQIIGDLATPSPTSYSLETIEPTSCWSVSHSDMNELLRTFPGQSSTDPSSYILRSYIFLQKRLVSILTGNAEQNFLEFREKQPELFRRLPQYHIASYLGISPEFLSKVIARTSRKS